MYKFVSGAVAIAAGGVLSVASHHYQQTNWWIFDFKTQFYRIN